jgi:hypothetical protein
MITTCEQYSPEIRLKLLVGEQSYPLAQISPEWVMLREEASLSPGQAEVVMTVDGRERRWDVVLADSPCRETQKIPILR